MKAELSNLLMNVEEFVVNGVLNKNKLSELARKYDAKLLNLLIKEESVKNHFFTTLEDGVLVFKKDVFLQFLNNKEFLPDSYTSYKTKIGLGIDNGDYISENNDVVLNFPYKDCILEGGQTKEDTKRQEVFFNKTLAPNEINRLLDNKVITNFKRYDKDGEHEVDSIEETDNLIIKGNNLIALHSLKKRYAGRVKLIYIDPPYNTGNDSFNYNDKFSRSTWLVFMKNRLKIAKELLTNDGNIVIQCDWHEAHYLKVLLDEIFGEDNFRNEIIWHYSSGGDYKKTFAKKHDTIFWYSKSENYSFYPQNKLVGEKRGTEKKNNMKKGIDSDGRVYFSIKSAGKEYRYYEDDLITPDDVWNISILQQKDPERTGFNSQKPERLLARIIGALSNEGDIVLDYHLGSATTASVAHKMNRQYIGIEQMNYIEEISIERLKSVIDGAKVGISKDVEWQGGGSFVYCELKNDAQDFLIKVENALSSEELVELLEKVKKSSFLSYRVDVKKLNKEEFTNLSLFEQKQLLEELVDQNNLYVNYSDIDDVDNNVTEKEKELNRQFYEGV
jgi:putative uncharacterized protein rmsM